MTAEWFPGHAGGSREQEVLAAVRQLALERGLRGARLEDTEASTPHEWPLMLSVRVPGHVAVRGVPELHVAVVYTDDQVQILGGWETFGFALDNEVDLLDLATGPEASAVSESVHAWIEEQLSRPVMQDEWRTWTGRIRRSWRFGDDGHRIEGERGTARLARRRAPIEWFECGSAQRSLMAAGRGVDQARSTRRRALAPMPDRWSSDP